MSKLRLNRRALLRGAGGAALALPALEIMSGGPRSAAAAAPKRFIVCYGGISVGGYSKPHDAVTPTTTGRYETTPGLRAAAELQVKDEVGIVSGLNVPWNQSQKGWRPVTFHSGNTMSLQVSGKRAIPRPGTDDTS